MKRQRARALNTMGKQLFWSAVGLGGLSGAIAIVVMMPGLFESDDGTGFDVVMLISFLVSIFPFAMFIGIALGVLSWAATYAALGILDARRPDATALHQAAVGGAGSMVGGLLPALLVFSAVLGDDPDLGIIYSISAGLLALCFILAFGTLLVLNRDEIRQRA